jgi:hypothetical protein
MAKTKEAKIKQFKMAFLKPAAPKGKKEVGKLKTQIEKAVKTAKSSSKESTAKNQMSSFMTRLHNEDKAYYDELVSYKLTKHWDEPHEFKLWSEQTKSPTDVATALRNMMGSAPSEDFVIECLTRLPSNTPVADLCFEKAPARMIKDGIAFVEKNKVAPPGDSPKFQSSVALELFKKGRPDDIPTSMDKYLQPEDARDMAQRDPSAFSKRFLEKAATTTKLALLKDPELRAAVMASKEDWDKLCKSAPVLPFFDAVQTRVASKNPSQGQLAAETAQAVFDELLEDGNPLGMTYYTNTFTPPSLMMGASEEDLKKKIAENHGKGDKDSMPDQPAAQCDELVTVLKYVMEGALGSSSGVACKHIVIPGMVLTVPINTLPGGLLKNTFGGNVYDDSTPGKLTKQVLFTGNDFGEDPNAHTYLDVGGVLYDAVLGTKGDAVTGAVAEEFGVWDKTGYESVAYPGTAIYVAKSKSSGNYIVKETDDRGALKAAANRAGFSTAYRLTTGANLARYAKKTT